MSSNPVRNAVPLVAALPLLIALAMVACTPGSSPTAPAEPEFAAPALQPVSGSQQVKSEVCHVEGNGSYSIVNVSDPAVQSHFDHGDWPVTAETCDGIDNDCDGEVDEDGVCAPVAVCPCFDAADLDAFTSPLICVNSVTGNGFPGEEASILDGSFSFVQSLSDATLGFRCSISTTGESANGIQFDAWQACNDLIITRQGEIGC